MSQWEAIDESEKSSGKKDGWAMNKNSNRYFFFLSPSYLLFCWRNTPRKKIRKIYRKFGLIKFNRFYWEIDEAYRKFSDLTELVKSIEKSYYKNKYRTGIPVEAATLIISVYALFSSAFYWFRFREKKKKVAEIKLKTLTHKLCIYLHSP